MRAVNLLPRADERSGLDRSQTIAVSVGAGTAVVVTGLLSLMFLSASAKVRENRADLEDAQQQVALLPPPAKGPSPMETQLADQQKQRIAVVSQALQKRVAWDRVLREVSLVLPDDVWLTSLTAKSPTSPTSSSTTAPAAPGAAPTGFTIDGSTYSHAAVARFLSRLSVLPDLQNVQLQKSSLGKVGTQPVVTFTVVADVRPPNAPAAPATTTTPSAATAAPATTTSGATS